MFVEGAFVSLLVAVNAYTIISECPDSIISNAAVFSAYLAQVFKDFWFTLNHIWHIRLNRLETNGDTSITEIFSSLLHYQKRISQYLSSFIFTGNYNIDGFFESSH